MHPQIIQPETDSPRWLREALEEVRARNTRLTLRSRAAAVAGRLLVALEVGVDDFDGDRPVGHEVPTPEVRATGHDGLAITWTIGDAAVRVMVDQWGHTQWEVQAVGRAFAPIDGMLRKPIADGPGPYAPVLQGRIAMRWLLCRRSMGSL